MDSTTREFAYVAIPENRTLHAGMERPYRKLAPILACFGVALPEHLQNRSMHLDPDFEHLTYGDQGQRANQLRTKLTRGDKLIFYSGLRDIRESRQLVYAIIGILSVAEIRSVISLPAALRDTNAHTRRVLADDAQDIVVIGDREASGRFASCIPIGEYRDRAYRVQPDILKAWGGLTVTNGYLQRSVQLPEFLDLPRFLGWLAAHQPTLVHSNNR